MNVLVTGPAGHIGSALLAELVHAGHEVVGLVRSDASADVVAGLGATPLRGDVNDVERLAEAAADADATVHLAFDNAAALRGDLAGASQADLAVVTALGDALAGTGKGLVAVGMTSTGDPAGDAMLAMNPRVVVPQAVHALAGRDVRAVLVGIPPVTHSDRDRHGFVPTLVGIARQAGASGWLGAGTARWPAVHTLDLAVLLRLAVERAPAGAQLLGAAEDDVTQRDVAEAIGRRLGLPSGPVAPEDAEERFGGFAMIMGLDFPPMADPRTRELVGWEPTRPGLLAALAERPL